MEAVLNSLPHLDEIHFSSKLSLLYIKKMLNLDEITNENKKKQ